MTRDLKRIFHAYDIRGKYPQEIDGEAAFHIAVAFCQHTHAKHVLVGHDSRASSPSLYEHVVRGIRHAGTKAVLAGMCTTPEFSWICAQYRYPAGLMITASHLPAQYNGIKVFGPHGTPIGMTEGLDRVMRIAETTSIAPDNHGTTETSNFRDAYVRWLTRYAPRSSRKTVIDASNGTGGIIMTPLLRKLPFKAKLVAGTPDPRFKGHSPNPLTRHAADRLKNAVLAEHADIGFILDGDADRVLAMTEKGALVHPNHLTAFLVRRLRRKSTIVVDSTTSRTVHEAAKIRGLHVIVSPVGRTHLLAAMKKHNAAFGAESSGHIFHKESHGADNDVLAIFKTLNALEHESRPFSKIIAEIARYPLKDIVVKATLETVLKKLRNLEPHRAFDGYQFVTADAWGFIRASNTEPIVRVRIEGIDQKAVDRVARLLAPKSL